MTATEERPAEVTHSDNGITAMHTEEARDKARKSQSANFYVRRYLTWLQENPPAKGARRESSEALAEKIMRCDDPVQRVQLIQRRLDALERESQPTGEDFVSGFVEWGRWFSDAHGISYAAWRSMNVPPEVLRQIGFVTPSVPADGTPRGPRRRWTPAFAQEVMDVWEAGGGSESIPGKSGGQHKGNLAVAEHFGYTPKHAHNVVYKARQELQLHERRLQQPAPEALAAD